MPVHDHGRETGRRKPAQRPAARSSSVPAPGLTPDQGLLGLQASAGNAAVVQMMRRAGLLDGRRRPGHSAGLEDRQAAHNVPAVQRSSVHAVLRTAGRPLDEATRTDMENRFGTDFTDVRVHDDGAARASTAEIGAHAYTSGSHIVLGDGGGDRHTLAHELTHVIQQRQGSVAGTDNGAGLRVSDPSDRFEREAEANAIRVMRATARVMRAPAGETAVQRAPRAVPHAGAGPVQRMGKKNSGHWSSKGDATKGKAVDGPKQGDHLFNALGDAMISLIPKLREQNESLLYESPDAQQAVNGLIDELQTLAEQAKRLRANEEYESAQAVVGGGAGRAGDANSQVYGKFVEGMRHAADILHYGVAWEEDPLVLSVTAVTTAGDLEAKIFDQDAYRRKVQENGMRGKKKQDSLNDWVRATKAHMLALFQKYLQVMNRIREESR
ncbi:eCIS core domain-containing protein [Kitasatospora sp. NPDC001132]